MKYEYMYLRCFTITLHARLESQVKEEDATEARHHELQASTARSIGISTFRTVNLKDTEGSKSKVRAGDGWVAAERGACWIFYQDQGRWRVVDLLCALGIILIISFQSPQLSAAMAGQSGDITKTGSPRPFNTTTGARRRCGRGRRPFNGLESRTKVTRTAISPAVHHRCVYEFVCLCARAHMCAWACICLCRATHAKLTAIALWVDRTS